MRFRHLSLCLTGILVAIWITGCGGDSANSTPAAQEAPGSPAASAAGLPTTSTAGSATTSAGAKLGTPSGKQFTIADPTFVALPGAKASFGVLGGAAYRIEMPAAWNGDLVLWAHGFAGFESQVAVDPPSAVLRKAWIDGGYAWAASSFSETGYVPGIGADDTLALKQFFTQQFGTPKRTYLVGASMGGNVVALSLENHASEYDGALAVCGALGGEEQLDYLASWLMVGTSLGGVPLSLESGNVQLLLAGLLSLSGRLGDPAQPTLQGRQFISVMNNLTGGPRPFFAEGLRQQWQVNFGFVLADPQRKSVPFAAVSTEDARYSVDPALGISNEQLNAMVSRLKPLAAARDAKAHPDAVPTSGNLGKPLLTLHGTGDLFVPISNEQSYRQKADAAGKGELLVQRIIRAAGHCQFSDEERLMAWNDLVAWVARGTKPAGDNVLGDLSDAGRQFTNPLRLGDPGTLR